MIAAVVQEKVALVEAQSEDLLTSTVFGLLRYFGPSPVWWALVERATSLRSSVKERHSLLSDLRRLEIDPMGYDRIQVVFWPQHPLHGEPDVVLCVQGAGVRPIVIGIEVKLWSPKSNKGEREDQLVRYCRLLGDESFVSSLFPNATDAFAAGLIYLTAADSGAELRDSADAWKLIVPNVPFPAYSLTWGDVRDVLLTASRDSAGTEAMMAADLCGYLDAMQLRPFTGFRACDLAPIVGASAYRASNRVSEGQP